MMRWPGSDHPASSAPINPCHVVFCDFDATYLPADPTAHQRAALAELETFLHDYDACELAFGWVTGSSLAAVTAKCLQHGVTVVPHFIASSLGTELAYLDDGELRRDEEWAGLVAAHRLDRRQAEDVAVELAERDIALFPQPSDGPTPTVSFYYRAQGPAEDRKALRLIAAAARARGIGLNLARCNPAAGDPADSYDVDFLPAVCGKREVVRYLTDRYATAPANTIAFGDSAADLEMLAAVGLGVLVANCTEEARARHPVVADEEYAAGVLATLRGHLHPPAEVRRHLGPSRARAL